MLFSFSYLTNCSSYTIQIPLRALSSFYFSFFLTWYTIKEVRVWKVDIKREAIFFGELRRSSITSLSGWRQKKGAKRDLQLAIVFWFSSTATTSRKSVVIEQKGEIQKGRKRGLCSLHTKRPLVGDLIRKWIKISICFNTSLYCS